MTATPQQVDEKFSLSLFRSLSTREFFTNRQTKENPSDRCERNEKHFHPILLTGYFVALFSVEEEDSSKYSAKWWWLAFSV